MSAFADTMELAAEAMLGCMPWETIVYRPRAAGSRNIKALVQRDLPLELANHEIVPATVLRVRDHATLGILASTLDTGGDRVTWRPKRGGAVKTSRIVRLLPHPPGIVVVELA